MAGQVRQFISWVEKAKGNNPASIKVMSNPKHADDTQKCLSTDKAVSPLIKEGDTQTWKSVIKIAV